MTDIHPLLVDQIHQRASGARLRFYRTPPACGLIANLAEAIGRSRPIWIGVSHLGPDNLEFWRKHQFGSSLDLRDPREVPLAGGGIIVDPTQKELDTVLADAGEWDIFHFFWAHELDWRGAVPLLYILDVGDKPGCRPRPRAVPGKLPAEVVF